MNRITMTALVLAVVFACAAGGSHAQSIYFDTFSGRELRPHWQQPPPGHREHTVADSRLTVSGLFHPGVPGQPNVASIEAGFGKVVQDVVVVTAVLGWNPGKSRMLSVRLHGPNVFVGAMGCDETSGVPQVFLQGPPLAPPPFTAPAPQPGTHLFRMMRTPDYALLSINGVSTLVFGGTGFEPFSRIEIMFSAPDGLLSAPLSIDLVRVVPSPAAMLVIVGGLLLAFHRRTR